MKSTNWLCNTHTRIREKKAQNLKNQYTLVEMQFLKSKMIGVGEEMMRGGIARSTLVEICPENKISLRSCDIS